MATSRPPGRFLAAPAHLGGLVGAAGALGLHLGGLIGPTWWIPAAAVYGLGALVASRRPAAAPDEPTIPPRQALEEGLALLAARHRELAPRLPREAGTLLDGIGGRVRAMLGIADDDAGDSHLRFVEARFAVDDAAEALERWRRVRPGAAGHPDAALAEALRLVVTRVQELLDAADEPARRAQQEHTDELRRRTAPPEDPSSLTDSRPWTRPPPPWTSRED
ncbi:hypothetical protein [Actinomycetospora aeridis]|uniref:5-bromo-4-chloroindolyl phosphate hydrolysis protein n=1 Tax=Actinomycetospora aeridis TaxID=3129231 RepID=A0ABU8N6Y6_9PSEU